MKFLGTEWEKHMQESVAMLLATDEIASTISADHIAKTPERFTKALREYLAGCLVNPKELLTQALFDGSYDQMVHIQGDKFYSTCAHHGAPFFGKYHFAYIPKGHLIGLSKIPRLVEVFSRRFQVQENLTEQIVDTFQEIVQPAGCALMMRGTHFCMEARGVQAHGASTTTTAFRGVFTAQQVREEFLLSANKLEWSL